MDNDVDTHGVPRVIDTCPMRKLTRRTRAKTDYLVYIGAHEWPVAVSGIGVVLGAVTILPSAVGIALSIVALVLGAVTLVRDIRALRKKWSGYDFTAIAAPFPTADVPPPAAYPDAQYLVFPSRGTALVSQPMDKSLWDKAFHVSVTPEPYQLPAHLRTTAPHVLPLRARGRVLFNGPVMGMRGEPLPPDGASPTPIRLHRARFFDAVCSNELCTLRITNRDTGDEYDLRKEELVSASGRLRTLAESELCDVIGVSTIAFTSDDKLVVVTQTSRNSASALLLAPSGSGSLEPKDLGAENLLHTTVRAGMERELCEETGVERGEILDTRLVGFARWMERGAKPEFLGLSRLSISSETLRSRRIHGAERLYSAGTTTVDLDLDELGKELSEGAELLQAASLPRRLRDDGSLPLLLCIRAAAAWHARPEMSLP